MCHMYMDMKVYCLLVLFLAACVTKSVDSHVWHVQQATLMICIENVLSKQSASPFNLNNTLNASK